MKEQNTQRAMVLSALGYGAGMAAGTLLIFFLLNNQLIDALVSLLDRLQIFLRLLFGIALIFVVVGLGGGVGGAIGGWVLSGVSDADNRRSFTWRSGASFFLAHAILVIPLLLVTYFVGFLNPDIDTTFSKLPTLFAAYGLLYGALAGLLLGWLTVGLRQTLGVFLASLIGFGVGGWLAGAGIYLFGQIDSPGRLVSVLSAMAILLVFGAGGGAALGFAYQYVHEKRTFLPQTRGWRTVRNVVLGIIALTLLLALGRLIETLTIRPADLAQTLPLTTIGTHWLAAEEEEIAALNPGPVPELFVDGNGHAVEIWCDAVGQVNVQVGGDEAVLIPFPRCLNQPVVAEDGEGTLHLVWYSDEAIKVTGVPSSGHFLYESTGHTSGWTEPVIVARPQDLTQPVLSSTADGTVLLAWDDQGQSKFATQTAYNCDDVPLSELGEVMYTAVRQEKFRPASDPIPYCHNRYDRLLFTPNPTSPDSDLPKTEYGAFDLVADLVRTAEYEVLFTTMQWDKPSEFGSPGLTLTTAVADLYEKVKANPDAYPRGMTVRILLGNVPELAVFEPTNQMTSLLQDLRDAGVTEMVNEEIGWNLEVANFGGAWPHAHSKFVVVDGKTALAAGFNYSYLHLSKSHPSGKGLDMNDLALQITGPVAQTVMAAYDDLWSGSDLISCSTFPPPLPTLEFLWCDRSVAEADHVPEVMRFYPTDGGANAFALHHTMVFLESDEAIAGVLESAQETIDIFEVNFSLDTICIVASLLGGICDAQELAPPYMKALVKAVVENDVQIRVLVEPSAMNGLENRIAIRWIQDELEKHGKTDNVSVKFYDGKMHDKGFLVDDQLLVIGSQNFHWSAWDTPSLTEYNMATEDPTAIQDFLQDFDYQWERGKAAAESMVVE
ncbi:MAG: hypothetical protein GWP61_08430 [Chloroflexi bacterium]|jgi:phosphatidylserine/phosphatidylglycerophosphate/cardiolipin synthase-like enzyme|nr:hypothetical protein [Chloroflexota bacterium]